MYIDSTSAIQMNMRNAYWICVILYDFVTDIMLSQAFDTSQLDVA